MKIFKRVLLIFGIILALLTLTVGFLWLYLPQAEFGFGRECEDEVSRTALLDAAVSHLGAAEGSDAHHAIIDAYNAHEPLAQGYAVKYNDDWCATFVSTVAIECNMAHSIPTECSCERQIGLWMALECWEESDSYLPLPGDIIYYDWDVRTLGNSTGWSDHVGIVIGTHGPFIKVIEGNKDDAVGYRYIIRWDPRIRGYGLPEYENEPVESSTGSFLSYFTHFDGFDQKCDCQNNGADQNNHQHPNKYIDNLLRSFIFDIASQLISKPSDGVIQLIARQVIDQGQNQLQQVVHYFATKPTFL